MPGPLDLLQVLGVPAAGRLVEGAVVAGPVVAGPVVPAPVPALVLGLAAGALLGALLGALVVGVALRLRRQEPHAVRPARGSALEAARVPVPELVARQPSTARRPGPSAEQLLEALGDAVLVVDADGIVVTANPAALALLGPGGVELVGRLEGSHWSELATTRMVALLLRGRTIVRGHGRVFDVRVSTVPAGVGYVVVVRDVTEFEDLRSELAELAVRDGLTGLHNRRYLDGILERVVADARAAGEPLSAVMVDLDHFKRVNDSHGHATGDLVLARISRELARFVRADDVLVRFGGEEFLMLLRGVDAVCALDRAELCRQRVASLEVPGLGGPVQVTVSMGLAALGPGDTGDCLVRAADDALYAAKEAGRDRVVLAGAP